MSRVGILAYGSLIEEPGKEIEPLIRERKEGIQTPFSIEFARSSSTRDGAPTVVPVENGGDCVQATILVLDAGVNLEQAQDLLWRRETRSECTDKHYAPPFKPNLNRMVVEQLENFAGLDVVLYTKLGANITDPNAAQLADLAINSAQAEAGRTGIDGISYLISVKRQGISTPLMHGYENEILRKTGASSLEDALSRCRKGARVFNNKPYLSINREERFFCSLFAHALLVSSTYRTRIIGTMNRRFGVALDPSELEVFLEVAALRDFWNDLGDPREYSPETHQRRRDILNEIMEMESLDPTTIDKHGLFWTNQPGSKLWSPGRWDVLRLDEANLSQLKRVRWAFNAKPDILLMSPASGLVIEAKLESGEGRIEEIGYEQLETQRLIIRLWKALIPEFANVREEPTTLKLVNDLATGLTWEDLIATEEDAGIDEFTRRGFLGLRRYTVQGAV